MNNILFITGTDTGVGKTEVTAGLCRLLQASGISVGVCKPVETGCERSPEGDLLAADAIFLQSCLPDESPLCAIDDIVLHRYAAAAAPSVAAAMIGDSIDVDSVCDRISSMAKRVDIVLVEGAGGLLVPISDKFTMLDVAGKLGASSLVVVASKLGALNHACLTFSALRAADLPIFGYVFNEISPFAEDVYPLARQTNRNELSRLAEQYDVYERAYLPVLENPRDVGEIDAAFKSMQMRPFLESIIEYFDVRR